MIIKPVIYRVERTRLNPKQSTWDSMLRRHVGSPRNEWVGDDAREFPAAVRVVVEDYGGEVSGAGSAEGVHVVVEIGFAVVVEAEAVGEEGEAYTVDGVGGDGGGGGGGGCEHAVAGDFGGGEGDVEAFGV